LIHDLIILVFTGKLRGIFSAPNNAKNILFISGLTIQLESFQYFINAIRLLLIQL